MKSILLFFAFYSTAGASPQIGKVIPHPVSIPSSKGATTPFLLKDGNSLWMSWQEPTPNLKPGKEKTWRVQIAKFQDGKWSIPHTVAESKKLMINWADFPSIQKDPQGHLYVSWLETPDSPPRAFDGSTSIPHTGSFTVF